MKLSGFLYGSLKNLPKAAAQMEASGIEVGVVSEGPNDATLSLTLAAEHTQKLELMSSIVVAFARSPMITATAAHQIQEFSNGRLILGLGSQIEPHITKRYSMPWSAPAKRMREYVQALKAIWACWNQGEKLDFRGEFYTHTLMTPFFAPKACDYGAPRVTIAAVGPKMSEVAGEVADGLAMHPFTSRRFVEQVTLPAIEAGLARSGRTRGDFSIIGMPLIVTGSNEQEFEKCRNAVCSQIAFYGSTPAYRPVLEVEGFGALHPELNALSKQGRWKEMPGLIEDSLLDQLAIVGLPNEIGKRLEERYGDVMDIGGPSPVAGTEQLQPLMLQALQQR